MGLISDDFPADQAWRYTGAGRGELAGEEHARQLTFHLGFPECRLPQGVGEAVCVAFEGAVSLFKLLVSEGSFVHNVRTNVHPNVLWRGGRTFPRNSGRASQAHPSSREPME